MDLNGWLDSVRLVACVGSGGVGKTTTAATIGLYAAARGRKVIVLTIDPAKRLANSLGLETMGGEPTPIDLGPLAASGVPLTDGGELWAMMLDSRGTFDALIAAVAPNAEARDRVLNNHVYRAMADALSGSQDYMATEKLYDLVQTGRWDLVVLDTPPVKNALDFLESPGKVVRFLDERILSWFLAPLRGGGGGGWASRLFSGGTAVLWKLLGTIFGHEFLDDFAQFLHDFNGLYEGFRARHAAVVELLHRPDTAFVTVCAPTAAATEIAAFFGRELAARGLNQAGVIVNQVHPTPTETAGGADALVSHVASQAPDVDPATVAALITHLQTALRRQIELAAHERQRMESLRAQRTTGFWREVPRLRQDVHDLPALWTLASSLFSDERPVR